jgi:hypothetical protein
VTVPSFPEKDFGTRSIAMQIVRAGKQLSRSSAQRILREQKPAPPSTPAEPPSQPSTIEPHHILRPKHVNRTWHIDLTTLDFLFIRFYVAAVVDGFSRKLLALKVYKDAPSARNMLALVKNCVKTFGTPRFLITDGGTQFRSKFGNQGQSPFSGHRLPVFWKNSSAFDAPFSAGGPREIINGDCPQFTPVYPVY